MKIIITEEKSSNMMSKLHNLKKIVSELTECFEECKEESSRNHRYDDDEYDKYSSKRKNRRDYDDEDYDDYDDDYKRSSRHSFPRNRY